MKKLVVLFLALFAVGCNNKPNDDEVVEKRDLCKFTFDNQSGVQVAVVIEFNDLPHSYKINIPDSLVLQSGQQHSWGMYLLEFYTKMTPIVYPYPPLGNVDRVKIYFDKTVSVEYVLPKEDRNPADMSNYVRSSSTDEKYKKQWTYTFTEEDYQNALELNKL